MPDNNRKHRDICSVAIRTRNYIGKPARIEIGGAIANSLTSVQKDSMIMEKGGGGAMNNEEIRIRKLTPLE